MLLLRIILYEIEPTQQFTQPFLFEPHSAVDRAKSSQGGMVSNKEIYS